MKKQMKAIKRKLGRPLKDLEDRKISLGFSASRPLAEIILKESEKHGSVSECIELNLRKVFKLKPL